MRDNASDRRTPGVSYACILLIALLVYALSTGPVIRFSISRRVPLPVITTVYAPLSALCRVWPPVQDFFDWYLEVWGIS